MDPTPAEFDNAEFVDNLEERIRRRTALSEEHLARERPGIIRRTIAKTGLALANGVDRLYDLFGGSTTQGILAGAGGAMRGGIGGMFAFWGFCLAVGVAWATMPVLGVFVAAGAIMMNVIDARQAYKEAQQHSPKIDGYENANSIARQTGAIPPAIDLVGAQEPVEKTGKQDGLFGLKDSTTPPVKQGGFVNFVEQSRAQQNIAKR